MPVAGVIGALIGLLAALGGVFVALFATGMFEYQGGKKKPGVESIGKDKLKGQIMGLNSPDLPYQVNPSEKADFELTWKIADAKWLGIFARESIKTTYRAFIYLDEPKHTVRFWEAIDNVEWVAGAPKVHYQREFFRGKVIYQKSAAVQYGIKEDKTFGKVYEYSFDINQIRGPIQKTVLDGGWEFVEVMMKKHAMKPEALPYKSYTDTN
jgi:hypothetical protein